jgi:hypothetical protein
MVFLEILGRSVVSLVGFSMVVVSRGWFSGNVRHFRGSAVAVMVVLAVAGCGRPSGVSFAPVTGRVVVHGQPLAAGTIHFFPDESKGTSGPMSTGVLQSDGSYSLHGPGQNVGAMVGSHRVYLTLPLLDQTPTPVVVDGEVVLQAPLRDAASGSVAQIPKKFLQAETSVWTATVTDGKANVLDFEITK